MLKQKNEKLESKIRDMSINYEASEALLASCRQEVGRLEMEVHGLVQALVACRLDLANAHQDLTIVRNNNCVLQRTCRECLAGGSAGAGGGRVGRGGRVPGH